MSPVALESAFISSKIEAVFLNAAVASEANKVAEGAPAFFTMETGEPADANFVADLLETDPPPGLSKAAVFPLGIREKGKEGFVGIGHLLLGFPTETTVFVGHLIIMDALAGKGYGQDFLEGVYNWARPQGINFIRIRVHPQNTGAKAWLDKMGFIDLPNKLSSGHEVWERKLPAVED